MPTLGRGPGVALGERPGEGTHTPATLVFPAGGHFPPHLPLPSSLPGGLALHPMWPTPETSRAASGGQGHAPGCAAEEGPRAPAVHNYRKSVYPSGHQFPQLPHPSVRVGSEDPKAILGRTHGYWGVSGSISLSLAQSSAGGEGREARQLRTASRAPRGHQTGGSKSL